MTDCVTWPDSGHCSYRRYALRWHTGNLRARIQETDQRRGVTHCNWRSSVFPNFTTTTQNSSSSCTSTYFKFISPINTNQIVAKKEKSQFFLPCRVAERHMLLYTGCPRRNGQNLGRMFLMLNYTDITQNIYMQSWTVTEIMAREVWNFDSCYTLIDYQIHTKTGRNMWFL